MFLLSACASKQVLVGKKCFLDDDLMGQVDVKTIKKSYIWFVEKDVNWSDQLNKENCLDG
tara:strand:- start:182 stop:361 length:180 start_codon:yes stop_codon:yes gene_type:complete